MYTVSRDIKGKASKVLMRTNDYDEAVKFRDDKEKIWSWYWCSRAMDALGCVPFYTLSKQVAA